MVAIYYVSSPFQLMSALSIAKGRNARENNIFLVLKGSISRTRNYEHFESIMKEARLYATLNVICFSSIVDLEFKLLYIFFKLKFIFPTVNEILVGDFRDLYSQLLLRRVKAHKRTLLDDGAATINIFSDYLDKGVTYPRVKGIYNRLRFAIYFLLGMRFNNDIKLNSESIFNGEKIKKDCFVGVKDKFFFIGSKYSEAGIIPLSLEVSLIIHVSTLHSMNMKYIPHRDDSDVKLALLKDAGVTICYLSTPVELFMKNLPNKNCVSLAGFWTTALYSLGRGFCFGDVTSYDICHFVKSESIRQSARNVYSYFRKVGITVVELKVDI